MATNPDLNRFEKLLRAAYRSQQVSADGVLPSDRWRAELMRRVRTLPSHSNAIERIILCSSRIACAGAFASLLLAAYIGFDPTEAIVSASADEFGEFGGSDIL